MPVHVGLPSIAVKIALRKRAVVKSHPLSCLDKNLCPFEGGNFETIHQGRRDMFGTNLSLSSKRSRDDEARRRASLSVSSFRIELNFARGLRSGRRAEQRRIAKGYAGRNNADSGFERKERATRDADKAAVFFVAKHRGSGRSVAEVTCPPDRITTGAHHKANLFV